MPVYLTRWPDGTCTLSHARNRASLMHILDEEGSPNGVRIKKLNISWSISVRPPSQATGMMSFQIELAATDAGSALGEAFEEFYPHLKVLTDAHLDDVFNDSIPEEEWSAEREKDLNCEIGEPNLKGSFEGTIPDHGLYLTDNLIPF